MKRCNYPHDNMLYGNNKNEGLIYLILGIMAGLILVFCLATPCQAVTKCYKDICVGQTVIVSKGLYKGNQVKILDILKERTPDDDKQVMRDSYRYYVSFKDGYIAELYREELKDSDL